MLQALLPWLAPTGTWPGQPLRQGQAAALFLQEQILQLPRVAGISRFPVSSFPCWACRMPAGFGLVSCQGVKPMITVPVSLQCRGCRPASVLLGAWIVVPARIRFLPAGSTSQGSGPAGGLFSSFFAVFLTHSWVLCVSSMTLCSTGGRQVNSSSLLSYDRSEESASERCHSFSPLWGFQSREGASGSTPQTHEDITFYPLAECYEPWFWTGSTALALLSLCSFIPFSTGVMLLFQPGVAVWLVWLMYNFAGGDL